MSKLISLVLERNCLSALLKYPDIFPDVDLFVKETDFSNRVHAAVYSIARDSFLSNQRLDKTLLAQKLKNLSIETQEGVDIFQYCDILYSSSVNRKGGVDFFKELVKLRIRRDLAKTGKEIHDFVTRAGNASIDEIIGQCDQIYHSTINQYNLEEEPADLYAGIKDLVLKTGENPVEEIGLKTKFPEFNKKFGGIQIGEGLGACVARAGIGKSSFLLNLAEGCIELNENCYVLYLDTEMKTSVNQFRLMAAKSGVNYWYLQTGNWNKNVELAQKVKNNLHTFDQYAGRLFHLRVANRPIEQVCSLIRRWYYKFIGRNDNRRVLIIYDYIKLTGEKIQNNWSEHQAIGEKINYLNALSVDLNVAMWVSMQMNRSAEQGVEDSSAIALSDRLQWFSIFNAIFKRKSLEEISEDGPEFGTHKLIPIKTRFQGRDASGHFDLVNVAMPGKKPKYLDNYINYSLVDFNVKECGTLKDVIDARREKYDLEADHHTTAEATL